MIAAACCPAGRVVEVMARLLVVAKVCEHAGVHVDEIGPVGVIHAGIEDHEAWRIPTADRAEAALVAGAGYELAENVVCGISLRAAFVDRIDNRSAVGSDENGNTLDIARRLIFARSDRKL